MRDLEAEQRAQINAGEGAEQAENQPQPTVRAARYDAAEKGADFAAEGKPRALAQQQPADVGGG